jgi:3-oxoacyl-[acyl-carrier-protein] synthase-3
MRLTETYLAGVGTSLPPAVTTAHAVAEGWYDEADRAASGMAAVRVAGRVPAPDLAVEAAAVALRRSGRAPGDFGALMHCTTYHQGPDGWSAPHYVLRRTLDRPISAMELRQGCVGMITALGLAAHRLIADRSAESVLLTAGDNFSVPTVDRWRASKLFLLADGGAAAVVSRTGGFAKVLSVSAFANPGMEELHRGGEDLFPPGIIEGHPLDFEARVRYWREQWAAGVTPPLGHIGECVAAAADLALADAGITMGEVKRVCHVGFAREALRTMYLEPLGVAEATGTWDLVREIGHAGAADPFLGLAHLWTRGEVVPGDHVLLVANAPGVESGCAVVRIVEPAEEGA